MPLHDLSPGTPVTGKVSLTGGDYTITSSFADVTSAALTLVTGPHRVLLVVTAIWANATGSRNVNRADITVDGTRQGGTLGLFTTTFAANDDFACSFSFITDVLSAGSHTFKIQAMKTGASAATMYASATAPTVFAAYELPI